VGGGGQNDTLCVHSAVTEKQRVTKYTKVTVMASADLENM